MRISLNWLSEYIQIPFTPTELADRLTMLGIEVEAIENPAEKMGKVVVGEVLEVTPHPNADKLRLTRVSINSDSEPLRIVCGAPNVRQGLKVAVATIGADLGEGFVIKKSKIRGEVSEGMLCSERELGLSDKHEGIWELPENLAVGAPLADALGLNDVIFEIGITPNRADCLSHIGIAREIAAITEATVTMPAIKASGSGGAITEHARVTIADPDLCPRYVAKLVRGVRIQPSPDWLKRKLEAVGLRPINNVVDVTNFVLMECGHPLHAFDFSSVEGGHVVVRTAEGFATDYTTLDSKVRKLPGHALLITDGVKPLGIAGIMGGENSEIRETTRDVLIESAYFQPSNIRKTAKALGLSTDASYRFERGTDIEILSYAVERAAQLIQELAGGEIVDGSIDEYPNPQRSKTFMFHPSRANRLIGANYTADQMKEVLGRLKIDIREDSADDWMLTSPSYRVDLQIAEDAAEEIARVIGYETIPTSEWEPTPLTGKRDPLKPKDFDDLARTTLLALGATECVSTPLVSDTDAALFAELPVELINPLNIEKNRMRSNLAINLLDAVRHNERFGAEGQRLFEIGNVFQYGKEHKGKLQLGAVVERKQIALVITGIQEPKSPYNSQPLKADVFLMKGMVSAMLNRMGVGPFRLVPSAKASSYLADSTSIAIEVAGATVGELGLVNSNVAKHFDLRGEAVIAVLDHEALYAAARQQRLEPSKVKALPKYPAVDRDLALVLAQDIQAARVIETIRSAASGELLQNVHVFDEFQSKEMKSENTRSLAFHLVFRSEEKTLEEGEVDDLIVLILKRLESELHARLRA